MDKIFANKVVIVTGGSSGIGRAAAIAFADRGAKVIVVDNVENSETIQLIQDSHHTAMFIKCDVSKAAEVEAMVKKTVSTFGHLDYAFNNAGIEGDVDKTDTHSEDAWDRTIAVNLKGIWLCMKYQIPQMLKQGKGAIVNNASVAGLKGFPGMPAYVASKHGVIGLTKTAALEYAKQNIRINAVCPGAIRTPMLERYMQDSKEAEQQLVNMEPIGRLGEPEEIAHAALWLCSEAASFITGQAIPVDGGWVA
jgi:NAD(P)-dependent dehydrogenase (short-subunit alcohol dehydrogenase family)